MNLIGYTVRDVVSGLTGIATRYIEMLSGSKQYAIQPRGDGKEMPAGYDIDVQTVEAVSPRVLAVISPDPNVVVRLGDEVEDIITGLRGIATVKTTFANGCTYFDVVGRKTPDDDDPKAAFVEHKRLKVIKMQRFQSERAQIVGGAQPAPETGGPMARMRSAR